MSLLERAQDLAKQAQELAGSGGDTAKVRELLSEAKALKENHELLLEAKSITDFATAPKNPFVSSNSTATDSDISKSINVIRFSNGTMLDENLGSIVKSIYGEDYYNVAEKDRASFVNYLRTGGHAGSLRQRLTPNQIKGMLEYGASIEDIKSTMVESQDVLGGVAVPAESSDKVLQRAAGLSAVRQAGAEVARTVSKSLEFVEYTGGNSRYPTAIRGSWGNETKNPPASTNVTMGLRNVPVHVYTFKLPMSYSLLEDATDLEKLFTNKVAETLGIDEDEAFLTGDGMQKPFGILPGGLNSRSLAEQVSLASADLTMSGLKLLPRKIGSQYRAAGRASMVGNSQTAGLIETLQDAEDRYYIDKLMVGEPISAISGKWYESEAMPSVSASAIPLIYGDFSGYVIVERTGLSVVRYNDSNTGINLVEFHVRRRVGGDVIEPWKFAVQKVAAS